VPHTLSAQTRTARSRGSSVAPLRARADGPPSPAPPAARAPPAPSSPEAARAGSQCALRAGAPGAATRGGVAGPGGSTQGVGPWGAPRGPARGQSAELMCGRQPLQPLSVLPRLAWLQAGLPGAAAPGLALAGLSGAAPPEPAQARLPGTGAPLEATCRPFRTAAAATALPGAPGARLAAGADGPRSHASAGGEARSPSPASRAPAGSSTTSGVRIDGAVTRMTPASAPQAHWAMPCMTSAGVL